MKKRKRKREKASATALITGGKLERKILEMMCMLSGILSCWFDVAQLQSDHLSEM